MMALGLVALGAYAWWRRQALGVMAAAIGIFGASLSVGWHTAMNGGGIATVPLAAALLRQEPWAHYVTVAKGVEAGWPMAACRQSCPQAGASWRRAAAAPLQYAAAAARGRALCAAAPCRPLRSSAAWLSPRVWWPLPGARTAVEEALLYLPAQGAGQACIEALAPSAGEATLVVQVGVDATVSAVSGMGLTPLRALQCDAFASALQGRRCVATAAAPPQRVRVCGPAFIVPPAECHAWTWRFLP